MMIGCTIFWDRMQLANLIVPGYFNDNINALKVGARCLYLIFNITRCCIFHFVRKILNAAYTVDDGTPIFNLYNEKISELFLLVNSVSINIWTRLLKKLSNL